MALPIAHAAAVAAVACTLLAGSAHAAFDACRARLQAQASEAGVSEDIVETVLGSVNPRRRIIKQDRGQPEFTTTFREYLRRRVTPARIERGRELLEAHRALLRQNVARYGVPAQYLVALWGLETNYGSYTGNVPTLDALATLACDRRRSTYFSTQVIEALRLVEAGAIEPQRMRGSWAGAMGNFQFMPSTYRRFAVDADGNGRRDLLDSLPDAFASAGNFLRSLGWQTGLRWGREVRLPEGFAYELAGLDGERPLHEWAELGVTRADGAPLPSAAVNAALLVPAGHRGPAFLVYENFRVLMGWNRSIFYALAVGRLADRIAGGAELRRAPPRLPRLSRTTVELVQRRLNTLGFDSGAPDGILGSNTRKAISAYQKAQGMVADGYPRPSVVARLQQPAAP